MLSASYRKISPKDVFLARYMVEDNILQSTPLSEDQKRLLLIEWFHTWSENRGSTAVFEEAVR